MTKSNAERQRAWYQRKVAKSKPFGGGREKRELTMRFLYHYLLKSGPMLMTDLYRKLNAWRDPEGWDWLKGEIIYNGWAGNDKLAPVTSRGSGRRGDPYQFQTSEEWDWETDGDWDANYKQPSY
jgi:hypothetical protein